MFVPGSEWDERGMADQHKKKVSVLAREYSDNKCEGFLCDALKTVTPGYALFLRP